MKCSDVQGVLADYSANGLSDNHARRVRDHIQECVACRNEWKVLTLTTRALDGIELRDPPKDLWPGIRTRIDAAQERRRRPHWIDAIRSIITPRRAYATLVVAGVSAFTFALVHLKPMDHGDEVVRPIQANSHSFVSGYVLTVGNRPLSDPIASGMLAMATKEQMRPGGNQ